jgi:very-short-patch-repair endonuclease
MRQIKMGTGVTSLQYVDDGKTEQARFLRRAATPAEIALWKELRNRKVAGLKFRRQQVIEGFIADFYCKSVKLVIEVDGGIHKSPDQRVTDAHREKVFKGRGITTLRLSNEMVLQNMPTVKAVISSDFFSAAPL